MKRRIFIAINLPEKVKKRLKEYQEKFDYLFTRHSFSDGGPVRWTKAPSLHLTLIFIGYVSDEQMLEACRVAREVASGVEPFFINFKRIVLGPSFAKASADAKALADKSEGKPRMIWLEGAVSRELNELKKKLEEALISRDAGLQKVESRLFDPHITLARVKMKHWREAQINPAEVEKKFEAQFEVNSIEVMESDLKYDGAEYATLESCPLTEN